MNRPLCCVVVGTRPEAIKLAPVAAALRADARWRVLVISTAQHRELLDDAVATLGLQVDRDLDLMRADQSPGALLGRAVLGLDAQFAELTPAVVVGEGDTNTALAAALAAFQRGIPFAHVEAGLRTDDLRVPFPEEANRRLIGRLASLHCAPTPRAAANLRGEGVATSAIEVTGNPVVDVLLAVTDRLPPPRIAPSLHRRLVLVTVHRRENFGPPLDQIVGAIRELASRGDLEFVLPLHPNPNVASTLRAGLGASPLVHILPPLGYLEFLAQLRASWLVLSDSGGVQEEAPSFGRPVLVLRDDTERIEGVEAGIARVVGTNTDHLRDAVVALMASPERYDRMVAGTNPYGDGHAAARIAAALSARFLSCPA